MKKLKNRVTGMLLAMLCFATLVVPAAAYERVDTQADTSLTIQYKDGETPLTGMEVRIYKVMTMTDAVQLEPTETFKAHGSFMDLTNQEAWSALAGTLDAYITASQSTDAPVAPTASGIVNENGEVVFDKAQTDVGVYLITGVTKELSGYRYTPQPCFVTLPLLEQVIDETTGAVTDEIWHYDAAVAGKVVRTNIPSSGSSSISRNVMKEWKDEGYTEYRPGEVTVTLYRDDVAYDTVTLSESNNWRTSWNDLDADSTWKLVEDDVAGGYDVSISQSGKTFVVTNTIDVPEIVEEDVPLGELPDLGDDDDDGFAMLDDEDVPLAMLPETGIPWWPVQVLATVGVLLFAAGYVVLRRGRGEA